LILIVESDQSTREGDDRRGSSKSKKAAQKEKRERFLIPADCTYRETSLLWLALPEGGKKSTGTRFCRAVSEEQFNALIASDEWKGIKKPWWPILHSCTSCSFFGWKL
jgi:hypothetical protein